MTETFKKRFQTSILLLILLYFMIINNLISTYVLIVFGVLSIVEFFQISKKIFSKLFFRYSINFFYLIYFNFFCYIFFLFNNFPYLKIILYTIIFGCVASDVGGYVFGKIFKGPKITSISPNKTYSGAFGSIILTCLAVFFPLFFFFPHLPLPSMIKATWFKRFIFDLSLFLFLIIFYQYFLYLSQ